MVCVVVPRASVQATSPCIASTPVVSVVTSTYNRASLLRRAIESVLAQDFQDWEMCIVGDCTPDDSAEVVASYGDGRLRFHNLTRKSPPRSHGAVAKNFALQQMVRGRYVAYLDDDDRYLPSFLSVMVGYMERHPEAQIAYCRARYRDRRTGRRIWGNPFQRWMLAYSREKLERYNFIVSNSVIHRKTLLDEVGYWNPAFYFDDYELWLRVAKKYDFHFVNRVLVEVFTEEEPFLKRLFLKAPLVFLRGRHTPLE